MEEMKKCIARRAQFQGSYDEMALADKGEPGPAGEYGPVGEMGPDGDLGEKKLV